MDAVGLSSSLRNRIVPAPALYLTSCPPIFTVCSDSTSFSSGSLLLSLAESLAANSGFFADSLLSWSGVDDSWGVLEGASAPERLMASVTATQLTSKRTLLCIAAD